MKKLSLLVLLGAGCLALVGCGTSDKEPLKEEGPTQPSVETYAVASCNKYLDFVQCVSSFAASEAEQEQITLMIDSMKADWDALSAEELQVECDEKWNMFVSIPEFAEHPQCGIQA